MCSGNCSCGLPVEEGRGNGLLKLTKFNQPIESLRYNIFSYLVLNSTSGSQGGIFLGSASFFCYTFCFHCVFSPGISQQWYQSHASLGFKIMFCVHLMYAWRVLPVSITFWFYKKNTPNVFLKIESTRKGANLCM